MPLKKTTKSNSGQVLVNSRTFYTLAEIAALLNLDEMTVYRFAQSGQLPAHKLGTVMRFHSDDLKRHQETSALRPQTKAYPSGSTGPSKSRKMQSATLENGLGPFKK
jgi:excisionase family DNA binding protein